jgi:hypothetical protein
MKQVEKIWAELSAKPQKVELSKLDDLLSWAQSTKADPFDELSRVARRAQKEEQNLYKKLQQIEEKEQEAREISRAIEELGGRDLLGTVKKAQDLLKLKRKNIREVIKLLKQAGRDSI